MGVVRQIQMRLRVFTHRIGAALQDDGIGFELRQDWQNQLFAHQIHFTVVETAWNRQI
jgi:hypothetical protein